MKNCILQLGRAGDILNALPLAKFLADGSDRAAFAVSRDYVGVVESATYCDPEVFKWPFENLLPARDHYSKKYRLLQTQVYGHGFIPKRVGLSFCEDSYACAGYHDDFLNGEFDEIVLNRRFRDDEMELADRFIGEDKRPVILVHTSGVSSPFRFGRQIRDLIWRRFSAQCKIVDLNQVHAKRIGDLLGLYERAAFLVTTDSAPLHLAGACPKLPYIAFITDFPSRWHGAYTRGNCLLRIRYGQYHLHASSIISLMERAIFRPQYTLRLVHCFHEPPLINHETWRRNRVALGTWNAAHVLGWITRVPLHLEDLPRRFRDGDRDMAYVKDLIDAACDECIPGRNDAIMLTNRDTCFSMDMYPRIVKAFEDGCIGFYGPRRDFQRLEEPLLPAEVSRGSDYPGTDLFVFRPEWWRGHRSSFPDMVLGGEAWDCILREQMRKQRMPCLKDLIYHERHASRWEIASNRFCLPMQRHNLKLATEALRKLDIGWKPGMFGVMEVA